MQGCLPCFARRCVFPSVLVVVLFSLASHACNVPVFRYALERWDAGKYELTTFHKGPISLTDQARLNELRTWAETNGANIVVQLVDLAATPTPEQLKLWQAQSNATLPLAILRLPDSDEAPAWSGAPAQLDPKALVSSPGRIELGRRLLGGDSIVWVLIESGDKGQDDGIANLITSESRKLESTLKLPPSAPDDPAPRSALPLRIAFSVQRLARTAAEDFFIRMMLHGETVESGKTIVVPVFGRGRALTALSSSEMTASVVRQAANFLCGACSCEVKEMNPGKDLLLPIHWESIFSAPPEPATTVAKPVAGQRVEIAPGSVETPSLAPVRPVHRQPNSRRGFKLLASVSLAFVAIVVLLVGIALLRSLRQR